MGRRRGVVAVLAVALVGVGLVVAVVGLVLSVVTPAGPVYSVAQVAVGLAEHPRAWVGRTITVRGTFAAVVDDDSVDPGGGVSSGYCWPNAPCIMGLPTDVPLHIFWSARRRGLWRRTRGCSPRCWSSGRRRLHHPSS